MAGRSLHLVERSVDPVADLEILLEGLEVDITRLGLDCSVKDQIDIPYNGGSIRLGGRGGGVELLSLDLGNLGVAELLENILHGGLLGSVVCTDQFLDLLAGGYDLHDFTVECETQIIDGLAVEGVCQCHGEHVSGSHDREDLVKARHARRNLMEKSGLRFEAGEIHGVHAEFRSDDLGEHLGRCDALIRQDRIDRVAGIRRFGQKFVSGRVIDDSGPLENVDDLMGIHGVFFSDRHPWCSR